MSEIPTIYDEPTQEYLDEQRAIIKRRIRAIEKRERSDELYENIQLWVFRAGSTAFMIVIIIRLLVMIWKLST